MKCIVMEGVRVVQLMNEMLLTAVVGRSVGSVGRSVESVESIGRVGRSINYEPLNCLGFEYQADEQHESVSQAAVFKSLKVPGFNFTRMLDFFLSSKIANESTSRGSFL